LEGTYVRRHDRQREDISECAKLGHCIEIMIFGFENLEILVRLIAEARTNT
jgi:hypothetical protein